MANLEVAMILRGAGDLTRVARRLHRITLGDRPFVALGRSERDEPGLDRALDGMLYLDADDLGGGLRAVLAQFRALARRVRLVVRADSARSIVKIAAMLPRTTTISIPPVSEREAELDRVLKAYGSDAVAALGASWLGFRPGDLAGPSQGRKTSPTVSSDLWLHEGSRFLAHDPEHGASTIHHDITSQCGTIDLGSRRAAILLEASFI